VTLLRDLSGESRKTLVMNLHSVDLALAHFPRIVGVRDGRVLFDLAPDKVSADLLSTLYTDHEDEEPQRDRFAEILPVSGVCRPLRP
jgi:phosphonate transport system ATP-binding protein